MGLDARKPVFGGLCTASAQADQHLCYSLVGKSLCLPIFYHCLNGIKFKIALFMEMHIGVALPGLFGVHRKGPVHSP